MQASWSDVIVGWSPFVLLIAFWIFFLVVMRKGGPVKEQREYLKRHQLHMDRTEELLERIALAVEARRAGKE